MAICGYGPVGSLCSLLMADYGYKVLLIDKNIGTSPTARAINTDGEQLRIFDKFGLAEKIVENSNQIEKIHFSKKNIVSIICHDDSQMTNMFKKKSNISKTQYV